jgi:HSP20 family protein
MTGQHHSDQHDSDSDHRDRDQGLLDTLDQPDLEDSEGHFEAEPEGGMALAKLPALAELDGIRARIARLAHGVWQPAADWFESDDDLVLVIDAPGIDARSIAMSHDGQEITIAAQREASHYGQSRSTERPQGGFQRSMRIPEPVEPGSAAAQYRLGQIEVHFRKLGRTITVIVEAIDI